MGIGVIAKLTIAEGKNAEFEAAFSKLQEAVNQNEPGNLFYAVHRSRTDNNVYVVLEQYKDQAALDAHGASDHMKALGGALGPLMAGRPDVEYFDAV